MNGHRFNRSLEELREVASFFWPPEISEKESEISVIPKLIETQDEFLALLSVPVADINGIFTIIDTSTLSANLFVKHLVVLADFGGEMLQRVNSRFDQLFPDRVMELIWKGRKITYHFQSLPVSGLTNAKLGIGGKELLQKHGLTYLLKDVIVLLVFGSTCSDEAVAEVLAKCEIGEYLGEPAKLQTFVKQRYIWVSRITGGAKANNLGQIVQQVVLSRLLAKFNGRGITFSPNAHIPGITHTDGKTLTTFDIVASDSKGKYVAIEVSFQVTTNSTIERKAGQAKARYDQIEGAGLKIAYLVDGAGNLVQRENATRTLCAYSHCTVAFSEAEIDILSDFLKEYF